MLTMAYGNIWELQIGVTFFLKANQQCENSDSNQLLIDNKIKAS